MMVGVPVLLVVCDSACVPPTWVMAVGVGVFWWCVFQCLVAVVSASSVVPGVLACVVLGACSGVAWLVPGASGARVGVAWLVACFPVVVVAWLALVGVSWLVCVSWFRMLTCLASLSCFLVVPIACLVNNAVWAGLVGLVCVFGCVACW